MKTAATTILIAAAVCLAAGGVAHAQALKKYITPDGKTVYSDTPVPGAASATPDSTATETPTS